MTENAINREELPVLLITEGPGRGQQRVMRGDQLLIGRGQHCELYIPDRRISREHSRIFRGEGGIYIEDLDSRNGTYINGEKLQDEPHLLHEGDEIQIALCVRVQFVGNEATVPLDIEDFPLQTNGEQPTRGLKLDKSTRQVTINGEQLEQQLSPFQYRLLELLYEQDGGVCTREEVVKRVWPDVVGDGVSEQAIDALVRRLRDKLAEIDPEHQYIVTVRGFGFRLEQPE